MDWFLKFGGFGNLDRFFEICTVFEIRTGFENLHSFYKRRQNVWDLQRVLIR